MSAHDNSWLIDGTLASFQPSATRRQPSGAQIAVDSIPAVRVCLDTNGGLAAHRWAAATIEGFMRQVLIRGAAERGISRFTSLHHSCDQLETTTPSVGFTSGGLLGNDASRHGGFMLMFATDVMESEYCAYLYANRDLPVLGTGIVMTISIIAASAVLGSNKVAPSTIVMSMFAISIGLWAMELIALVVIRREYFALREVVQREDETQDRTNEDTSHVPDELDELGERSHANPLAMTMSQTDGATTSKSIDTDLNRMLLSDKSTFSESPTRRLFRQNAARHELVLIAVMLTNALFSVSLYIGKSYCLEATQGAAMAFELCVNAIGWDGAMIACVNISGFVFFTRCWRYFCILVVSMILFFGVRFLPAPGIPPLYMPSLWSSLLLHTMASAISLAGVYFVDRSRRNQFFDVVELHVCALHTSVARKDALRAQIASHLPTSLPTEGVLTLRRPHWTSEDAVVATLALANFSSWCSYRSPLDVLVLMKRVSHVVDREMSHRGHVERELPVVIKSRPCGDETSYVWGAFAASSREVARSRDQHHQESPCHSRDCEINNNHLLCECLLQRVEECQRRVIEAIGRRKNKALLTDDGCTEIPTSTGWKNCCDEIALVAGIDIGPVTVALSRFGGIAILGGAVEGARRCAEPLRVAMRSSPPHVAVSTAFAKRLERHGSATDDEAPANTALYVPTAHTSVLLDTSERPPPPPPPRPPPRIDDFIRSEEPDEWSTMLGSSARMVHLNDDVNAPLNNDEVRNAVRRVEQRTEIVKHMLLSSKFVDPETESKFVEDMLRHNPEPQRTLLFGLAALSLSIVIVATIELYAPYDSSRVLFTDSWSQRRTLVLLVAQMFVSSILFLIGYLTIGDNHQSMRYALFAAMVWWEGCALGVIFVAPVGTTLGNAQTGWMFAIALISFVRPVWRAPLAMWIGDLSVFAAFVARAFYTPVEYREQNGHIADTLLALLYSLYFLMIRLQWANLRREQFSLRMRISFLDDELRKKYDEQESIVVSVAPNGIAAALLATMAKHKHASGDNPLASGSPNEFGVPLCTDTVVIGDHRAQSQQTKDWMFIRPDRSTRLATSTEEVDLVVIEHGILAQQRKVNSTSQVSAEAPPMSFEEFQALQAMLAHIVAQFSDVVDVVKSSAAVTVIATRPDPAMSNEMRASVMLRLLPQLLSELRSMAALSWRAVVSSGPTVGAIFGHSNMCFDYFGAHVAVALGLAPQLPNGSCVVTSRFLRVACVGLGIPFNAAGSTELCFVSHSLGNPRGSLVATVNEINVDGQPILRYHEVATCDGALSEGGTLRVGPFQRYKLRGCPVLTLHTVSSGACS